MLRVVRTWVVLFFVAVLSLHASPLFGASIQFMHKAGVHEFTAGSNWVKGKSPGASDCAYFHLGGGGSGSTLTFAGNVKTADIRASEKANINFSVSDGRNAYSWTVLGKGYPQIGNNAGSDKSPTTTTIKLSAGAMNIFGTQYWIGNKTARSPINSADVIVDGAVMRYFGAADQAGWLQVFASGAVTIQNNGVFEVSLDSSSWKPPLIHPGASLTLKSGGQMVVMGGKSTLNLMLEGLLQGDGAIDVSGIVSASDTSTISPGGEQAGGTLMIKTGGLASVGTVKIEVGAAARDQIILEGEGQTAKLDRPITFSALPGSMASPSAKFVDFVVADNIEYGTQSITSDRASLKSLLATAGYSETFSYGIVKVGASDYNGNYVGFDALRLTYTPSASASR